MLQRIQTVYLIFVFIFVGVLPFFIPLWSINGIQPYFFIQNMIYIVINAVISVLTLVSIFSFNNRQNQFVINRLNIILNLILLGLFLYHLLNLSGETQKVSEKGVGIFLPIVAIVLLVFANKSIKKDEDLVKSADRLR
jgi:peptidoglycan/LPS O-acetylase OafA/YrhL